VAPFGAAAAGDLRDPERAARPGSVVHRRRLAEPGADLGRQHAREDVVGRARRERHQQGDGPCRRARLLLLRHGGAGAGRQDRARAGDEAASAAHQPMARAARRGSAPP
jgi:hypothetical protein